MTHDRSAADSILFGARRFVVQQILFDSARGAGAVSIRFGPARRSAADSIRFGAQRDTADSIRFDSARERSAADSIRFDSAHGIA